MQKTVASSESFTSFKIAVYLAIFVVITTVLLEMAGLLGCATLFAEQVSCALSHVTRLAILQYGCLRRGPG